MNEDEELCKASEPEHTREMFQREITLMREDFERQIKELYMQYEQSQKECLFLKESLKRLLNI